jgi:SM-20-related protein
MLPAATPSQTERVADALAGPGFAVLAGFLAPAAVRGVAAALHGRFAAGEFRAAAVGLGSTSAVRPEVRGDQICWLEVTDEPAAPAEVAAIALLEALRVGLNRELMLGLETRELHYASYGAGRGYVRHLDRSPRGVERVVTVVLYLNEAWCGDDGGELVIAADDGDRVIAPVGGTLVVFSSARLEHEVRVSRRERLSLTGWFSRRAAGTAPI